MGIDDVQKSCTNNMTPNHEGGKKVLKEYETIFPIQLKSYQFNSSDRVKLSKGERKWVGKVSPANYYLFQRVL